MRAAWRAVRRGARPRAWSGAIGLCALVLWRPAPAVAGAWTREPGSVFASLAYQRIAADAFFGPNFEPIPIRRYVQQTVSAYAEAGVVSRWLTLVFDGQLYRRNSLADQGFTEGLSDLRVGAWTGVLVSPVRLSLGLLVGLPTGDSKPRAAPGADADAQHIAAILPTGDGEADVELRASLGHSFGGRNSRWPLLHYVQLDVGYWLRTAGFADAFTWAFELGTQLPWRFLERFWLIAKLNGVESFASAAEAASTASGLGNGLTFAAFGVQLHGRLAGGFGAAVQVDSAFRARGVASGANVRLSLTYER